MDFTKTRNCEPDMVCNEGNTDMIRLDVFSRNPSFQGVSARVTSFLGPMCRTETNNWRKMHGYPMRRKGCGRKRKFVPSEREIELPSFQYLMLQAFRNQRLF